MSVAEPISFPTPRSPGPSASDEQRPSNFEETFARETRRLFHERAKILHWAALTIYASFWLLDVLFEPTRMVHFLVIRMMVCLCFGIGLFALYSSRGRELAPTAVFVNGLAAVTGITLMTALMSGRDGGFQSVYFVGIMIVMFSIGYFMPWSVRAIVSLSGAMIGIYVAIDAYHALVLENQSLLEMLEHAVAPVSFLLGTSAFTALATHAGIATRRRDLSLRLQLQNANAELKELDEAKTRFFANVSHELRSPLTLLLGPIETLRSERIDSTADRGRLLDSMRTNANRLLRQVDALLDVAKLEAGSLRLDLAEGNVGELLQEVVDSALPHASNRGIDLRSEGLHGLPDSLFDHDKVWVIAGNLLSNALKFTREGHVTVRAHVADDTVQFTVEDSGPGIPEGEREKIFDRFYQVDASFSRSHQGTGVGLALARELARLHGGDLTVESEVGRGSTFRCSLPLEPEESPERRQQPRRREDRLALARTRALTAHEYRRARGDTVLADIDPPKLSPRLEARPTVDGSATVLFVDDNDDLRTYMAGELATQYRVIEARDGVEALEVLRTQPIDLVVSDLMMPRLDGRQLCAEIRADGSLANLPVILVTARASSEAIVEGLKIGADDYVTKPFVVKELEARIAAHLRRRQAEQSLLERESRLAAIGQMTSAVAHDLRNALTIVKGYAELADLLVQEDERSSALNEPLQQIRIAVDRLGRMTEEILQFARGGTPTLHRTEVEIRPYLEEMVVPLTADLVRRRIELRLNCDRLDEGLHADLDRDAMARVLENLVANARDALANREGERVIEVSAATLDGDLLLAVSDNGPGIPAELLGQIFEPFKSGKKSTGLGLATVRNIVKAHGGDIEVEANGSRGGATFSIRLPVSAAARSTSSPA